MRFTVAGRSSFFLGVLGALLSATVLTLSIAAGARAQQTVVAATVCEPASSISLTQPVSDSTVTQSPVPLAGTVNQATQIEIYVDDIFDSVIPLGVAQTSFTGSVQLAQGTHTIKVVAVNVCPGPNGSDSSVITYTPPPSTGGGGDQTDTSAGGSGSVESETGPPVTSGEEPLLSLPFVPREAEKVFEDIGKWLNIVATYEAPASSRLTLLRATTIAVGSWLLAFGIATTVVQWLGSVLPMFSDMPSTRRSKIIARIIRGIGLLMVVAGLFL